MGEVSRCCDQQHVVLHHTSLTLIISDANLGHVPLFFVFIVTNCLHLDPPPVKKCEDV